MFRRRFLQLVGAVSIFLFGRPLSLAVVMNELEKVTAIHAILHDDLSNKLQRIDSIYHLVPAPISATLTQIHTIRHGSHSSAGKMVLIHDECHEFLDAVPPPPPPTEYDGVIIGNFQGTIPNGEHWHITGDVTLTGDFINEGLVTAIDTFTLDGQGFQILGQNGGRFILQGKVKSDWMLWGASTPVNWAVGERIGVTPTANPLGLTQAQAEAAGCWTPTILPWTGAWGSMSRPSNSADVTMANVVVRKPEVVNLDRSITLKNLSRVHFHNAAGVQILRHLRVLDSGIDGILAMYPIHFHLNGDASRGSVVESVVVENGQNHAFVPHGSHGISFPGCVAWNTKGVPFWWDEPPKPDLTPENNSDDIDWSRTLVCGVEIAQNVSGNRLAGYYLGAGLTADSGNKCNGAVAVGVHGQYPKSGGMGRSGFHWPEGATGLDDWEFEDCVAHNNKENGIFVWQNARSHINVVRRFIGFRNGYSDISHGAYINMYQYLGAVLTDSLWSLIQHAESAPEGPLVFEDIITNRPLLVPKHASALQYPNYYRRCEWPAGIVYDEPSNGSYNIMEDGGLVPADFTLTLIAAETIIEIKEAGILTYRRANGVWT